MIFLFSGSAASAMAAATLLRAGTARTVVERLVDETVGNPLALLEVSQQLDSAQQVGTAPLPDPLPVGERLRRLYRATLAGLSPAAWRAVLLLALSGAAEKASTALARARVLTDRAGTTSAAAHQAIAFAFCALCRGDLGQVVSLLEQRLAVDGGVGAAGEPLGVAPLLVEAYVGLGRLEHARVLTARYAQATPPAAAPLSIAFVGRCKAITVGDDVIAQEAFEAAIEAHRRAWDPFEAARTRLLYGGRLRRAGQRVAARGHLTAARDAFHSMDLTHWSRVAADELAATGAVARRRPSTGDEPLTSQETRVALLVAQGMSNREIGASLFLSPKTVERHLSNVFRKHGFRSRTELAASFARSPASQSINRPPR
jgi:DNA-binding CsgD family transcriptional regulator